MLCPLMYNQIAMAILCHIFLLIDRLYALARFLSILPILLSTDHFLTAIMSFLTILKTIDPIILLERVKHNFFITVIGPIKLSLA